MARIRTIKPEFCVSEQLAECSTNARLVFALMWMFCDDQGIHPAKPLTLKGEIFPLDDKITATDVTGWINELIAVGVVKEYTVGSERYWMVTGWKRHQKIDKPSRKYPAPIDEDSPNPPRTFDEPSPPEGKGRESNGREGNKQPSKQAAPNTSQAVPDEAPLAALAAVCLRSRVNADGGKGLLHLRQFVADGVTEAMLTDAVLLARDRKPDPEVIPIAYLAPIIADLRSGKARARPATWEETKAAAMAAIAAKEAASGPH